MGPTPTDVVRQLHLRADLSLLKEGAEVAIGFGIRSLEGLGEVAEYLEHGVYEKGSRQSNRGAVTFTLRNPPLRMGAFRSVRASLDGVWAAETSTVQPGGSPAPVPLGSIDRGHPVTLPIGLRTRFTLRGVDPTPRKGKVRLELVSVAIPPLVWYEFTDEIRREAPAP
jgi:hypothetical protein